MSQPKSVERTIRAIQQRLLHAFRADFATPPKRLLVGFSGGSDSLALSLVLKRVAGAMLSSIKLVHVNHKLRPDSNEDAVAASTLAEFLDLPLVIREIQGDVRQLHPGVGIEEAARRERYLQFQAECDDGDVIVLGHHAQDQAETILLHLMRGAGLQGASGMNRLSSIDVPWWNATEASGALPVWRPLLGEDREELRTIPSVFSLFPVEDPSNADKSIRRNALRHRVIPQLTEIDPGAIEAIGRFGMIVLGEDRLLAQLASEQANEIEDGMGGLRVGLLLGIDVALQRRVVQQWLKECIGESPSFERVSAVLALAASGSESAQIEIFHDKLAGSFHGSLRCGDGSTLCEHARRDAGLILPLSEDQHPRSIEEAFAVVRNDDPREYLAAVPRPNHPYSEMIVRHVRDDELIVGAGTSVKEWMRRERISPWIRDQVTGIALDDRMWWIPRINDDYMDGEPMYVRWAAEEKN